MAPFVRRLPPGSRILDGGCGIGEWTVFLAQQGFEVTGIDLSTATVERLRQWFPAHDFRHADLRQTGFPDASFDAYFSWGTFEHFECGLGECLAEARRIVRPGGWLFISVPFYNWRLRMGDAGALERWDAQYVRGAGYARPLRFYQWRLTQPELRREMEMHGFRVHRIAPISKLTGAGRVLHRHLPALKKGTLPYRLARRALATAAPAAYLAHMILGVAERR
jgi:SAM-dependent methyltransferase